AGVIGRPLLERPRRLAGDSLDRRQHGRLLDAAVDIEAEERVHVFGGHALLELGPGLLVRQRLRTQIAADRLAEDPKLVGWQQRPRAAQPVCLAGVLIAVEECGGGDGADVERVVDGVGAARTAPAESSW